jgi:Matrixin
VREQAPLPAENDFFRVPSETGAQSDYQRKYLTYQSTLGKWGSGAIVWRYNDAGRPATAPSTSALTVQRIQVAMAKWSAVCNVSFSYAGTTTQTPLLAITPSLSSLDNVNTVGWGNLGASTQTGVAGISGNGTTLSEGDVAFNIQYVGSFAATGSGGANIFDATAVHEVGHMIGLKHSNVQGALMSGPNSPPDPSTNYTGLGNLTQDDIDGCRSMYGAATAAAPSISGTATLSSGGSVNEGTQICASPSAGVSCTTTASGSYSCNVPSGWTGTLHLQAGNSSRVAAKRFTSGVTSAQSGQDFVVSSSTAFACNLDIDNNGLFEPSTDGVMILRKLMGVTGVSQLTAASSVCAQRTNQSDMLNYLNARSYNFDAGTFSAAREGLVLLRLMLGMSGTQAVVGTGYTWPAIQSALNSSCGTNF